MAHIGMKYPVAAPWKEGNTYEEGFVIGKAINFTGTPNKNEVELYADDGVAETDKSTKDWGTSLGMDDVELKVLADLLGTDTKRRRQKAARRRMRKWRSELTMWRRTLAWAFTSAAERTT